MKHISQIDNVDNLRALIRQELRELGIKVPKIKKSKRGNNKAQDTVKSTLFGSYLAHAHCVHIPECGYVAKFLVDAAEIIKANINSEGIFRKSGAVSRQKEIKQQLENGTGFKDANVHDVTAIVKQFFRELPEPLFTSCYHNTFIQCYQIEEETVAVRAILLLCLLLPGEHISTLRFIMLLFASVAANSATNKMDTNNLAVVLAPNVMRVNTKTETMKSCEEKLLQVQTSVVGLLIEHAGEVGMVDQDLVDKTAFMSEVFSTDDELDASGDDCLEDTKETTGRGKKDKKRKRSGSFQGFVSSIITKWRRSTDGKTTNTSNISQSSNVSQMSTTSDKRAESRHTDRDGGHQAPVYQFSAHEATPVVKQKKGTSLASESRAFSASKKKAILKYLPQQTTLASTPFTPASNMKRMDINSVRRGAGNLETPCMPPRPYQCTPRGSMKTPRKKLALFSPASTTKKKRYSSTTNLPSVQSASKKPGKSKGILRRLSGSRGDQVAGGSASKAGIKQQIGHRLASPDSPSAGCETTADASSLKDDSPIAAIATNASFSTSVCERSVVSNFDDDRMSLNEGFLINDEKEGDISRIMSEPALAGSHVTGEYVMIGSMPPREALSETTLMSESQFETPRGRNRTFSVDSILDNSTKKSSLKRGRPNSLKAGLMQGDQEEVQKLRRSFGLDKSDIGFPVPISVADTSNCYQYIQLDTTLDDLNDCGASKYQHASSNDADVSGDGSVFRNKVSCSSVADSMTGYECDDEQSEAGFSVVSSSTASCQKITTLSDTTKIVQLEQNGSSSDLKKTLAEQKQESKDSLLSSTSVSLTPPLSHSRDREMTRSVSADSGKGSLYEEPMEEGANVTLDSITSSILDKESSVSTVSTMEVSAVKGFSALDLPKPTTASTSASSSLADMTVTSSFCDNMPTFEPTSPLERLLPNTKSVSSQDLTRESKQTPTVSRSKSLLETSLSQRKQNVKPNLQISAETHKLLARAGYIKDNLVQQEETDDFPVSGSLSFPVMKPDESALNPRRESIIALRKNNAGYVKNNVLQFDRKSGDSDVRRHTSPLRFPNSTSRNKGVSPLKIPTAFNMTEAFADGVAIMRDKLHAGTARVPISTQLIKPSNPVAEAQDTVNEVQAGGLKRKPSVYYADRDSVTSSLNRYKNTQSGLVCITELSDEDLTPSTDSSETMEFQFDSVFEDRDLIKQPLAGCSKTQGRNAGDQSEVDQISNKENSVDSEQLDVCENLSFFPTTPVNVEGSLRTATNKTPVEILRTTMHQRSPVKPLKRLRSPHSPRVDNARSHRIVRSKATTLSTSNKRNDELNNF